MMGAGSAIADWYTPGEGKWGSSDAKWKAFATQHDFSKKHHQQVYDWKAMDAEGNALNKHFGDRPWQKKTCWVCHDPHSKGVEGAQLKMKVSDNSLCLSCHAGHGFADETEIMAHTGHSMGASDCVACHMPMTVKSQAKWNENGGDGHSHVFEVINPNLTKRMAKKNKGTVGEGVAIPNGCYYCHKNDSDYSADRWNRWKEAGYGAAH